LLEERQPLLLVPVPHSTEVLRNCIRKLDPTSTSEENSDGDGDAIEEKLEMNGTSDGSRKRRLENATDDEALRERNDVHVKQRNLKASASSTPMDNRFTWWPEGCMNSDPEHCPVLAKMYYPENEEAATSETQSNSQPQPRLQLNDIVEVYGILSLDPLGASFEDQNSNGKGSNLDFEAQQESFFHDFVDRMVVPPPSLLPRLHVLKYNKLDLDEMVVEAEAQEQEQEQVKAPVNCSAANANDCERQLTIDTFATCIFDGDKIASETLLMTCMSLAERDYRCQNANASPKAIQMPDGATLGCGSINFVLSTREACMLLQERLRVVLGEIAPVVANINLSLAALNGGDIDAGTGTRSTSHDTIIAPGKNAANRLEPSALQLPKASCLVINQAALTEGTINQSGQMALASLSKMTRTHTIPYQFDGLMEIDFEADHRIIVISSNDDNSSRGGGGRLLPCSMTMKLDFSSNGDDTPMENVSSAIPHNIVSRICRYISKCRSPQKTIALPRLVLERAQKDFIDWRKNGMSQLSRDVEEQDFHRWLLSTRLQARSRIGTHRREVSEDIEATVQDWENAVHLDCKMQGTCS